MARFARVVVPGIHHHVTGTRYFCEVSMAQLKETMPAIEIDPALLKQWGEIWLGTVGSVNKETGKPKDKKPGCLDKAQGMRFGKLFDNAFGAALADMLGEIPIVAPKATSLLPPEADCVEVGTTRVIGGVRSQNYDAAYRPDGPRVVYDSKTLNDKMSVTKNWQNMVNDLAAEAATVHTRFPYCIVAFIVVLPKPCLSVSKVATMSRIYERLGSRKDELDQTHLAEVVSLVIWNPETGTIDPDFPSFDSSLRLEKFSDTLSPHYWDRYRGLPPHDA